MVFVWCAVFQSSLQPIPPHSRPMIILLHHHFFFEDKKIAFTRMKNSMSTSNVSNIPFLLGLFSRIENYVKRYEMMLKKTV